MGERRGGEEGGGGRVISISGGETRIFRVPRLYCIPFRGGAIHFWCDGQTESANALWRGPTPLWCFLQRLCCTISRNNAPPEGFSLFLSREISASSCRGNVTNPRKFHSWPQSARSKDDGWRWDRTRRCFGKKGKRTLIRGVSWCNAGKYGRFLRGRKVKVRRRFFFFICSGLWGERVYLLFVPQTLWGYVEMVLFSCVEYYFFCFMEVWCAKWVRERSGKEYLIFFLSFFFNFPTGIKSIVFFVFMECVLKYWLHVSQLDRKK